MKFIIHSFLCLALSINCFAQDSTTSRKELNKARPAYLELGAGTAYSYFRDLATGPIYYNGNPSSFNAHYHRFDSLRETRFGGTFSVGSYGFAIGNEQAISFVNSLSLDFSKLYLLEKLSNQKYKTKVGGTFMLTGNMRSDPSLENSGFGYEMIYNFMASAKVSRDVSRTETKAGKFLFIKYNWKPRKRLLSYQLNLGLLNAHIRNGYSYLNQSQLLNKSPFFTDYEHTFFEGFRMNSALRYTIYFHTGNAIRFAYVWDAYTTGQEDVKLEMATHLLSVALLINL